MPGEPCTPGADLFTDKQAAARLTALFAIDERVEVEATCGIYQRMVAAYRHPDSRGPRADGQAVRVAERQGQLMVEMVQAALREVDLSPEQASALKAALARQARELMGS